MTCIENNETIDFILGSYKKDLGADFEPYRNHVYRVFNFAILNVKTDREIKILGIATAFHDLGIWTNNTFDYLMPSIELAKKYCLMNCIDNDSINEIEIIIGEHHKLTRIKNNRLAEIFRQADLTDLSLGLIHNGIDKKSIRYIRAMFPNKGFHFKLVRLFFENLLVNPLRPLPMYKV